MSKGKLHTERQDFLDSNFRAFGIFAGLIPDLMWDYVACNVLDFQDTGFDFFEFEENNGYFIPRSQKEFLVYKSGIPNAFILNAMEMGVAVTLEMIDAILTIQLNSIPADKLKGAVSAIEIIKNNRKKLVEYSVSNLDPVFNQYYF